MDRDLNDISFWQMSKMTAIKKSLPSLSCDAEVLECVISSPIGNIGVTMCEEGLHSVGLKGDISDENFVPNERYVDSRELGYWQLVC